MLVRVITSTRTDVVDVDPDVKSSFLEVVAKLEDGRLGVPLVADEDVTDANFNHETIGRQHSLIDQMLRNVQL